MPAPKPSAPPTASKLDTSQGNATAALYGAAIGPINNDYYLPLFTQFEEAHRLRLAWNWAACLYTVNWMIFRGLGLAALAYAATVAGAALLLFGLGHLIFQLTPATEWALVGTLVGLLFGVPGLLGNWLLYTVYRKKMASALRDSATLHEACALLTRGASSRQRFLWLVSVNILAMAAVLALFGWSTLHTAEPGSTLIASPVPASVASGTVGQRIGSVDLPLSQTSMSPAQSGLVTNVENPETAASEAPVPASSALQPEPVPAPAITAAPDKAAAAPILANPIMVARPAPPARQRFYINVGLFAKEANAQNALNKLERAGLPTLSGTVDTARGVRTRVRAGPFNSERDAKVAATTIRALNLDAVVMQQSP